ncbi:XRE family transcriptional regulator [Streptomyces sp. NPDC058486]|uniref:XRE family transcriptional regulator n=1 Tax=unclassified Streptomyces TaxID=2593676 RepID=UPI00365DB42E
MQTDHTERARTAEAEARAHQASMDVSISEIAQFLQETFSQRTVAFLAGIKDAKQVGRWCKSQNAPRYDSEVRLRTAFQVFRYVEECENRHVARAWMMGMNPQLEDDAPLQALAGDRFKDVMAAARSYRQGDL